jgi:hypothetical protein
LTRRTNTLVAGSGGEKVRRNFGGSSFAWVVQQEVIMKRMFLVSAIFIGAAVGAGWATAQAQQPAQAPSPAASKDATRSKPSTEPAPAAMMGQRRPGKGGHGMMMGGGMMGMGNGTCPMVAGAGTKVEVKNLPKGVTITFTNDDATVVAKLQKMAEAMRLTQEAQTP